MIILGSLESFLFVLIELILLGVTAEALRANIDRRFRRGCVSFGQIFK